MNERKKLKVALFGHPADISHLDSYISFFNPQVQLSSDELKVKLIEWTPSFIGKRFEEPIISNEAVGIYPFHTGITYMPEMTYFSMRDIYEKIIEGFRISIEEGASYVALGAFTSIICIGKEKELENEFNVKITSGNTLTAALAVAQVENAARLMHVPIENSTIAIIGGSGDIGSGCALALCTKAKKLILTARGLNRLRKAAEKISAFARSEIEISTDIASGLKAADIIISTVASIDPVIYSDHVKPGVIICDVAFPKSLAANIFGREDILVFSGGITEIPEAMNFGYTVGLPNERTLFGCFAEGLLLAAEQVTEPFSHDRGNITIEKMNYIYSIAQKYGFQPAPFYAQSKKISHDDILNIRSHAQKVSACA